MSKTTATPDIIQRRLPITLQVEPRLKGTSPGLSIITSLAAVLVALILGGILIALVGGDPFATYAHIANVAFGSLGGITDTLTKATPLILVGLACALAFRMKLWNIGAEGQFYIGAWAASAVVLIPLLPATASPFLFIPAMMIAGMLGGAAWGFIPGFLKARFKVNEVITTLMLNYIAVAWNNFWIFAVWTEGGFQMSPMFPRTSWLPRLSDLAAQIKDFRGLTLHGGFIIALLAAVVVWFILNRSKWGYEIRLIGDNPKAAEYAGIPIRRNIVLVMMASGALAGLAGMSEISGVVHRLQGAISPGYGFTGIIIAWLAKLNPYAVIIVSILFGALLLAGREIQPSGIPKMIQGIVLVCLIASDFFTRYRVRIARRTEA
ncbi:Fructose import permease protein FrcC [Thermoflexales bacterium]|nr:Fructose import permease protein FrcC [Thermoflexales bacterium]